MSDRGGMWDVFFFLEPNRHPTTRRTALGQRCSTCQEITSRVLVSSFTRVPHLSAQLQLMSLAAGCTIFSAETVLSLCLYSAECRKALVYPRQQEQRLGDTQRPAAEAADSSQLPNKNCNGLYERAAPSTTVVL